MLHPKHKIKVESGYFAFYDFKAFKRDLDRYEGKDIALVIKNYAEDRTNAQNRYYWSVVVDIISHELGYDREEMHGILKHRFLEPIVKKFGDSEVEVYPSTTKLDTKEMTEYLDRIKRFAAEELNIFIPDPGDYDY